MQQLSEVAPAFIDMAHRIVWCTVATVDHDQRPRSRMLHPLWSWDGDRLTGVIATRPTPVKVANLEASPYLSCNYWSPDQDVATAECRATWADDDETCQEVWDAFMDAPEPVGYDPAIIPPWADGPASPAFAVLELEPWRIRVSHGLGGDAMNWRTSAS